ncbi:head decoration protein [Klebsiella oxytoca]|nr:head decoration protein [Klebsiella oxytoca]
MTTQIGKFEPVNLLAGEMYRSTKGVTMKAGQIYPAGSVVAIDGSDKGVLLDSADASLELSGVLAGEVDATDGDAAGVLYLTGEFNRNALTFGGADTYEDHEDAARIVGIFFLDTSVFPE